MKTAIVTGANSGIGKVTAIELAKLGYCVVLACRNMEKGERALVEIKKIHPESRAELMIVDVGEQDSVDGFADAFLQKYPTLDLLVNNAGVWNSDRYENSKGYESMFAINHLGYVYGTYRLLPGLLKSENARIVNVSSNAHRWATSDLSDLQWTSRKWSSKNAYGVSKMANIWFTKELAKRLPEHLTVNALHPGVITTNLADGFIGSLFSTFSFLLKTPEQGARTQLFLATSDRVQGKSGGFYSDSKEKSPNKLARDEKLAQKMWSISDDLLGIRFDDLFE